MKIQLILATCLIAGTTVAQTGLIAHKSHSGSAATFALADPGNFGEPPSRLVKVIWINDTTVLTQTDPFGNGDTPIEDTVYHHPVYSDPNIAVDTLKKMHYYGVEFENFDKKEVRTPPRVKADPQKNNNAKPASTKSKSRSKKKSSLFWLWIIGGGTFTGILLFSGRNKKSVNQIETAL